MEYPIWIGCTVLNKVYNYFQKQPLWVAHKIVELDVIRLDAGDIDLTIQWYQLILGIYISDLFYRLYYYNPLQFQKHTHLVHANRSKTKFSGIYEKHISARYTILPPSELLHANNL